MPVDVAISVKNLHKTYRLYANPWHQLREKVPGLKSKARYREVHALRDISLEIPHATCVGLVGGNGAGKSTLLKILTGTTFPTHGSYRIEGRVASLLELGAGFNKNFSGRENIFMNAALMGFGRKEAKRKYQEILDFSELHEFINAPLRTYSSGMVCRLGFSVAVATDPDVLILDEVFAVGDMHFRRKCADRILDYRQRGKTMFFCSHSLYDVRQICDRAIWLKKGQVQMYDDSTLVTNEYATYENQLIAEQEEASVAPWDEEQAGRETPQPMAPAQTKAAMPRIVTAEIVDPQTRKPRHTFAPGEDVAVRIHVKNGEVYEKLNLAVGLTRKDGTLCMAMTTEFDDVLIEAGEAVVTLVMPGLRLLSGEFVVPVWLLDEKGVHRFHEQPCAENLVIQNRNRELGLFLCDRRWDVDVLQGPPANV